MSTTTNLNSGDFEYIAQGLDRLTEMRVNYGVEVTMFTYGDEVFDLEWSDEPAEYVVKAIH